jgi:hypothetical protein
MTGSSGGRSSGTFACCHIILSSSTMDPRLASALPCWSCGPGRPSPLAPGAAVLSTFEADASPLLASRLCPALKVDSVFQVCRLEVSLRIRAAAKPAYESHLCKPVNLSALQLQSIDHMSCLWRRVRSHQGPAVQLGSCPSSVGPWWTPQIAVWVPHSARPQSCQTAGLSCSCEGLHAAWTDTHDGASGPSFTALQRSPVPSNKLFQVVISRVWQCCCTPSSASGGPRCHCRCPPPPSEPQPRPLSSGEPCATGPGSRPSHLLSRALSGC